MSFRKRKIENFVQGKQTNKQEKEMNIGTIVELIESMVKSTTMSSNEGAYGSGMAGAPFDPVGFIKKPQVILRILGIVSI